MVNLYIRKNIVLLSKKDPNYKNFVGNFLVKFEDVTKPDYLNSTRGKKRFRTVKERRDLYNDTQDFITFSRGILELIPRSEYTATYLEDESLPKIEVPVLSYDQIKKTLDVFDLRDDQIVAVNKALVMKRGVIQLPTATGKSAIITSIIKRLHEVNPSMRSLVIAPTLSTVKNINNTLKKNGVETSVFGHPDKDIVTPVTTGLVQSLVSDGRDDLLSGIDAVFYDECLPSNSKILLADGSSKKISDIFEDESINEVLSYNVKTQSYEVRKILRKFKTPYNDRFCKVYYKRMIKGDYRLEGVSCTPNHKIYVKDRGYVQASEINQGDLIKVDYDFARNWKTLDKFTWVPVERVTFNVGRVAEYKYNLEVEETHCYFANNVLVSNCHHLKCDTWNRLNYMLPNVEYSLGFSALSIDKNEIFKQDFRELSYDASLIVGSSGRVLMHMDPSYYIEKGIIALPVVMRVQHHELLPSNIDESDWHKVVKLGLMSTTRTNKIAQVASIFSRHNRKVLILVSEKEYAFTVCRFLVQNNITNFGISFGAGNGFVFGGFGPPTEEDDLNIQYKKEDSLEVVDKLSSGEINILIATSHLDEGVDVNGLDACILACGGKKDRRIIQRVGRVLRKSKNGKYAYVVDFTDTGSNVLSRQSKSRLNMYKKDIGVPRDNIFDGIKIDQIEEKFLELERT